MNEISQIRADINRLNSNISTGMASVNVLIEQAQKGVASIGERLDRKTREDNDRDLANARELAQTVTRLSMLVERMNEIARSVDDHSKRLTAMETVRDDVTGSFKLATAQLVSTEKDKERIHERKKAVIQFWVTICTLALPGIIALIWALMGLPGQPPGPPQSSRPPAAQAQK
jgi:chromosome segregation ATPase